MCHALTLSLIRLLTHSLSLTRFSLSALLVVLPTWTSLSALLLWVTMPSSQTQHSLLCAVALPSTIQVGRHATLRAVSLLPSLPALLLSAPVPLLQPTALTPLCYRSALYYPGWMTCCSLRCQSVGHTR